jgi:thiamine pyrophosphokinase
MTDVIVSTCTPITVIGGGDASLDDLHRAMSFASSCVAADGGAALGIEAGVRLEAVIGDFDSVTPQTLTQIPAHRQHHVAEQNSTDFQKVLMRINTPLVLGVGFLGGRLDHELGALHVLMAYAHQPCILMNATQIVFVAPRKMALPAQAGDLVSLFPLLDVTGRSTGLKWPIDGLSFRPGLKVGTSNCADGPFEVEMDGPGMLMILPASFISSVVAAFLKPDHVPWPSHAE